MLTSQLRSNVILALDFVMKASIRSVMTDGSSTSERRIKSQLCSCSVGSDDLLIIHHDSEFEGCLVSVALWARWLSLDHVLLTTISQHHLLHKNILKPKICLREELDFKMESDGMVHNSNYTF